MKRARCAWVGTMVVIVGLLPALGALASIQYAPTEENLRVLAETDKNLAMVQQLLDRGVNPNAVDWRGRSAVHVAARHGAVKNLHAILQAGGAPNVQDQDGSTPLHVAIREGERNGKMNVVKALLAGRADPCIRDAKGQTPYHVSSDQDGLRREIDRARGHARACDGQPEAAQTNQATSAATNVGQAENVTRDPWGTDGGTDQDVWDRTLSTDADPWGVSETPWSQDDRFADGLTDDESAEEADADYTAELEAAMGEAAEQETQEGDYVAALTQLEREAEERRQAELARQRAEAEERRQAAEREAERERERAAEERRQAELARQRAEAEERRQAAEREAEREREEAEEEAEWERQQAAEEQEERERQQHQEAMNRMTRQMEESTNRMLAAMQAARQRGEDPRRALHDQLLREQGLGEIVERRRREEERRQQEAKQRQEEYNRQVARQQEEYNRQVARQQEEYNRQRQEAERKAEQRRREAERERERQRQAQAEQRRQAELRAKLKSAVATQCIQKRWGKRTIVTKQGKLGFDNRRLTIRNGCSRSINIKGICLDGKGITKHQILGGTVFIPYSGLGLSTLRPGPWKPSEWAQLCADEGYSFNYIACTVPYTPYYTTSDASTYRCFE